MNIEYFNRQMRALNDQAQQFATQYPEHAQMLNLKELRDKDPYVERLLEGVAFLTAQVHERIDADVPEISEVFLQQLWPSMLRPVPSLVIMQYQGNTNAKTQILNRGLEFKSKAVGHEKTMCRFTSTEDLTVNPIELTQVEWASKMNGNSSLVFSFKLGELADIEHIDLSKIKLFIQTEQYLASELVYAFTENLVNAAFKTDKTSQKISVESNINSYDLFPDEYREFSGFHLLHQYFSFPEKNNFITFSGVQSAWLEKGDKQFSIEIETKFNFPKSHKVSKDNFLLHCVPAINLFHSNSEPILLEHHRTEYHLIPNLNAIHSVFPYSVIAIASKNDDTGEEKPLKNLYDFEHRESKYGHYSVRYYYNAKKIPEFMLQFGGVDFNKIEKLSTEIICHNGDYPRQYLRMKELQSQDENGKVLFSNITRPSRLLMPTVIKHYQWSLIRCLSLNYQDLSEAKNLIALLELFNWDDKPETKRHIHSIKSLTMVSTEKIKRGAMRIGIEVQMILDEEHFSSEGELYIFAKTLHHFFVMYADINLFVQTRVNFSVKHGEWLWEQ